MVWTGSLGEAQYEEALAAYGLQGLPVRRLPGGNTNASIVVRDGEHDLVLTFFLEKSQQQVSALAALLVHLADHGFPTNPLVRTGDGRRVACVAGWPVLVKRWVPGRLIEDASPAHLRSVGRVLARLHGLPVPDRLPARDLFGLPQVNAVVGSGVDPDFEAWVADRLPRLRRAVGSGLPAGLAHGDLFADNVVLTTKGPYFLDFEESCRLPHILDLGMALVGLCSPQGVPNPAAEGALLAGYEEVRALGEAERVALHPSAALAALACATWRCWRYRIHVERAHRHHPMQALSGRWYISV
ncbi:MAG: phosphotransferase [Deltaproteobacteria bacterium]|nr:phosphotransferase [Deltaproteobacteria bacterium]